MFLTQDTGWLAPITKIFGILMNAIYEGLSAIGIGNIGLAIVIFTIITRILLTPMTIKQQKSTKLMQFVQPEVAAIQKKYAGRTDNESMMRQQQEMKEVYDKYGVSMTGGCLQLLIQMPIIFALYRVIMDIPAYVSKIRIAFVNIVDALGGVSVVTKLQEFATTNKLQALNVSENIEAQKNFIIDFLYKLNPAQFNNLLSTFPETTQEIVSKDIQFINQTNSFLGLNLATPPSFYGLSITPYLLIPVFAFLSQYLASVYMQKTTTRANANDENDQMAQSMKMMNVMMPLMSAFFCFQFATGLGVYWIASSVIMVVQQIIINMQLSKLDMDSLIKQNIEKANKKRQKNGLPILDPEKIVNNIKTTEAKKEQQIEERNKILENKDEKEKKANDYYFNEENKDSLFAKANMVAKYNEKHSK